MMFKLSLQNSGQVIMTYAIVLAVVALALGLMQVYIRRGIQTAIKTAADEIGVQSEFEDYPYYSQERVVTQGRRDTGELMGAHTLKVLETTETIYRESIGIIGWEADYE